jgi:hypothetical protein
LLVKLRVFQQLCAAVHRNCDAEQPPKKQLCAKDFLSDLAQNGHAKASSPVSTLRRSFSETLCLGHFSSVMLLVYALGEGGRRQFVSLKRAAWSMKRERASRYVRGTLDLV